MSKLLMSKLICNKKFKAVAVAVLALTVLTSCDTKQQTGSLLGATTGALIGSQFGRGAGSLIGIGAGALIGGFLGSEIGKSMDEQDKAKMQRTTQSSLERSKTGQTSTWKNPDSGHSGTVTPTRTLQEDGKYCREYTQTVTIDGKTEKAYGTACRQPDGSWQMNG